VVRFLKLLLPREERREDRKHRDAQHHHREHRFNEGETAAAHEASPPDRCGSILSCGGGHVR
jgi:hypothetical protein